MRLSFKDNKHMIVLWLLAAGMLISNALIYLYYTRPAEKALAHIENEYQIKRAENKQGIDGPAGISMEVKGAYGELPRWEEFTRVMGEVYNKAEKLDLLIESASYQPSPVKDSGIVEVKVSMPVTGTYSDIKRFVYELETSPRLFIIETLSLGSAKGEDGDISLRLVLAAYYKTN